MADVATKVLSTVNASYGADLSAEQLAARIVDPASASANDASVFAFFSEVRAGLQTQFIASMGLDESGRGSSRPSLQRRRDILFRCRREIMAQGESSQWPRLFDLALGLIEQVKGTAYDFDWTFGGGTALMLQIDHRDSHDVDLFLEDPQLLPFFNPATQNFQLDRWPDDYESDGSRVVKLIFKGLGEIDFICCGAITEPPAHRSEIRGRSVLVETPAEIVARKSTIGVRDFSRAT